MQDFLFRSRFVSRERRIRILGGWCNIKDVNSLAERKIKCPNAKIVSRCIILRHGIDVMNNTNGYCRRTISPIGSTLTGQLSTDNFFHPTTVIYLCRLYLPVQLRLFGSTRYRDRRPLEKFRRDPALTTKRPDNCFTIRDSLPKIRAINCLVSTAPRQPMANLRILGTSIGWKRLDRRRAWSGAVTRIRDSFWSISFRTNDENTTENWVKL